MNEKISLQDLVALLAEKANITKKDAETLVKECFDTMGEGLVKDKLLKIRNLGTFKLVRVEDRESVDVSTGERVIIPAHYKITFSPDIELAEKVNTPYASFENTEIEEDEDEPSEKTEEKVEEKIEAKKTMAEVENIQTATENEEELINSEEYYDEDSKPTKSKKGLVWLFSIIAFLLILFFAGRYFCPMICRDVARCKGDARIASTQPDTATLRAADIPKEQTPDTLVVDSVRTPSPQTGNLPSKEFFNKTYRVLDGERLTLIALREYGHKAFWVYIYEENRNRISNPDLINPGMVIDIPPAEKYGIDKNNPEAVKKALELEQKYKR